MDNRDAIIAQLYRDLGPYACPRCDSSEWELSVNRYGVSVVCAECGAFIEDVDVDADPAEEQRVYY
jgi:transcription initiation factor TFIIIB Brf1 subunit/transcription initiation factor TFIIB